jgi:hypothetical protein
MYSVQTHFGFWRGTTVNPEDNDRTGELALHRTLQFMIEATHLSHSEPPPVVVFLYVDHSGMPRSEVDHFIDELLETSAITYSLKDRRSGGIAPFERWGMGRLGEQAEVADYIDSNRGPILQGNTRNLRKRLGRNLAAASFSLRVGV